jgi:hypothetical protein
VRLRKWAAPTSDKEPVFGFVIHGAYRLPTKNAAGDVFKTKDLLAMYEEAQQLLGIDYTPTTTILKLFVIVENKARRALID